MLIWNASPTDPLGSQSDLRREGTVAIEAGEAVYPRQAAVNPPSDGPVLASLLNYLSNLTWLRLVCKPVRGLECVEGLGEVFG